jgi:hypothetical protein
LNIPGGNGETSGAMFFELAEHLGYSQSSILNALKKRLNMNFK